MLSAVQDGAESVLIIEGNGNAGQQDFGICEPRLFIFWWINRNGMAQRRQGLRQCANNIGEPARFGEGNTFRSGKDDVHGPSVDDLTTLDATPEKSKSQKETRSIWPRATSLNWDKPFWPIRARRKRLLLRWVTSRRM